MHGAVRGRQCINTGMLAAGNHAGGGPVHADVLRHREDFEIHRGHRAAFLIGDERVSGEAFGFGPRAGGEGRCG